MQENLDVFLKDFGVSCSANGVDFRALLDQPDEMLQMAGVNVKSTMYQLTVRTSDVGLASISSGTAMVASGISGVVRDVVSLDDGAFCNVSFSAN